MAKMKILVVVKQVVSDIAALQIKNNDIDYDLVNWQTSALDLVAIEQAILFQEQGRASEITAVTIGPELADKSLRTALAMGVDQAFHIETETENLDILGYCNLLQAFISERHFDLVVSGREDFDGGAGKTGHLLAGLLGWPAADFISLVQPQDDETLKVISDIDNGQQQLLLGLPCILSVDSGLCMPRFVKFPKLLKARKMEIEKRQAESYGLDLAPHYQRVSLSKIPQNRKNIRLENVAQLADILVKLP